MDPFRPGPFRQIFDDPRGKASGDTEGGNGLRSFQIERGCHSGRSTECSDYPVKANPGVE